MTLYMALHMEVNVSCSAGDIYFSLWLHPALSVKPLQMSWLSALPTSAARML